MLGRSVALDPFASFFKLSLDLVESQPHGGIKILAGIAFFFGMRHEEPLAKYRKPNRPLEDNTLVPAVHLFDHDFATASGKVEATQAIRLHAHQLLD